jgi:hypothetical protein
LRRALSIILSVIAFGPIARAQSLDQQERCAQLAKRTFADLEAEHRADMKTAGLGTSPFSDDYRSHYNVKLGKCLMLIERLDMLGSQSAARAFVVDANERRQYANFVWISEDGKKMWEISPKVCELTPRWSETRLCMSRKEFDELVGPYMEE